MLAVNKKTVFHYVLIYIMFMMNDSYLFKVYLSNYNIVFAVIAIVILLYCGYDFIRTSISSPVIFSVFLLAAAVFVRFSAGGVGIAAWLRWVTPILWVLCVIVYDSDNVLERFLKLVYAMSIISLVCYVICQINPDILTNLFPSHYAAGKSVINWTSSTTANYRTEYADGLLLYSVRFTEYNRNNGVFSEPGLYQMVLSIALFIAVFIPNLKIEKRKLNRIILVLIITIVTTMSTSGYLSLFVILIAYILGQRKMETHRLSKSLILVFCLVGIILAYDYSINETNSLLYTTVIGKIFTDGSVNLNASSGYWRMLTIQTSWSSMLKNPFGVGYDNMSELLTSGSTGAQIFVFGAAIGVIPFVISQLWQLIPVIRTPIFGIPEKICFIFIFYNCLLSQSKEFYAVLLLIPIFIMMIDTGYVEIDEPDVETQEQIDVKT